MKSGKLYKHKLNTSENNATISPDSRTNTIFSTWYIFI